MMCSTARPGSPPLRRIPCLGCALPAEDEARPTGAPMVIPAAPRFPLRTPFSRSSHAHPSAADLYVELRLATQIPCAPARRDLTSLAGSARDLRSERICCPFSPPACPSSPPGAEGGLGATGAQGLRREVTWGQARPRREWGGAQAAGAGSPESEVGAQPPAPAGSSSGPPSPGIGRQAPACLARRGRGEGSEPAGWGGGFHLHLTGPLSRQFRHGSWRRDCSSSNWNEAEGRGDAPRGLPERLKAPRI